MVIHRKIRQSFIAIHYFFSTEHYIVGAHIYKSPDAMVSASIQDMTGSINIDLIDTTKLEHFFTRHAIRGKVEDAVCST